MRGAAVAVSNLRVGVRKFSLRRYQRVGGGDDRVSHGDAEWRRGTLRGDSRVFRGLYDVHVSVGRASWR